MNMNELKFPETLYVAHYNHSREEVPSLNACLTEKEAIETRTDRPVAVGQYQLVSVRKITFKIEEQP